MVEVVHQVLNWYQWIELCIALHNLFHFQKAKELFEEADINGDGTLSYDEFHALFERAKKKYPQVEVELAAADRDIKK